MNPAGTTLGELMQRKETQFQQSIYDEGWNNCKREVLEILKKSTKKCQSLHGDVPSCRYCDCVGELKQEIKKL